MFLTRQFGYVNNIWRGKALEASSSGMLGVFVAEEAQRIVAASGNEIMAAAEVSIMKASASCVVYAARWSLIRGEIDT